MRCVNYCPLSYHMKHAYSRLSVEVGRGTLEMCGHYKDAFPGGPPDPECMWAGHLCPV